VETAKALEVSVSTVKTRMRRARWELKEILQKASRPAIRNTDTEANSLALARHSEEAWLS
jgi:hypothetical protein